MKTKRLQLDRISTKILLSYLSILLVPLCAIITIYVTSTRTILDFQKEKNLYTLNQSSQTVETRFNELRHLTSYIASDQFTNTIVNRSVHTNSGPDIYQMYRLVNSFPNYQLTNQMIQDVYIVFNQAGYTAKLPSAFPTNSYTYENFVGFHGVSYDAFSALQTTPGLMGRLLLFSDEEGESLLMTRSFPSVSSPQGIVVIDIQLSTIRDILENNDTGPGGGIYVQDGQGELVAFVGADPALLEEFPADAGEGSFELTLAGQEFVACSVRSGDDWRYLSLVPRSHLLQQMWYIRAIIAALAAVSVGIGCLICLVLWQRRDRFYKKVSRIAKSSGIEPPAAKSEYGFLDGAVTSFIDVMDSMRTSLEQQKELLVSSVLRKLLYGEYEDSGQMAAELEACGLGLEYTHYSLVNVSLPDPRQLRLPLDQLLPFRLYLKRLIAAHLPFPHQICDLDNSCFTVVLMDQEAHATEELRELFGRITPQISQENRDAVVFAVSGPGHSPSELALLYRQTQEIQEYMGYLEMSGFLAAEELPQGDSLFHFPVAEELRLAHLVRTGREEELRQLLDELYEENLRRRSLSLPMVREFCEALRRGLLRVLRDEAADGELQGLLPGLEEAESFTEIFDCAVAANHLFSRLARKENDAESSRLREVLEELVEKRFPDPAFNLYSLSEATGMSESALYKEFKALFGVTFSEYLERRRINEACTLLDRQIPIKDVAERVGYTSDHTFRRAFKRIVKVLPSQYFL